MHFGEKLADALDADETEFEDGGVVAGLDYLFFLGCGCAAVLVKNFLKTYEFLVLKFEFNLVNIADINFSLLQIGQLLLLFPALLQLRHRRVPKVGIVIRHIAKVDMRADREGVPCSQR